MAIFESTQPIAVFDETVMEITSVVCETLKQTEEGSSSSSKLTSKVSESIPTSVSSSAIQPPAPTRMSHEQLKKMNLELKSLLKEMQAKASMSPSPIQHAPLAEKDAPKMALTKDEAAKITLEIKSLLFQTPSPSPPRPLSPVHLISRNPIKHDDTPKHGQVVSQPRRFFSSHYSDVLPQRYHLTHTSCSSRYYHNPSSPRGPHHHHTHFQGMAQPIYSFYQPAKQSHLTKYPNKKSAAVIANEIKSILGI